MIGESNLRAYCRRPMGVLVSFGGVSEYPDGDPICGLFDRPEAISLGISSSAGMQGAKPTIQIPFNAFDPMPASGDTITVSEHDTPMDYTVNAPTAIDDGAFLSYDLFRVTDGDADEDDEQ